MTVSIQIDATGVYPVPIILLNPTTLQPEPFPTPDTLTVASILDANGNAFTVEPIAAVIGADSTGKPIVTVNALTEPSANTENIQVTVTDSAGDVAGVLTVNYPVPPQPGDISFDVSNIAVGTQPAPTAPGP